MARPYHRRIVSSVNRAYSSDPAESIESISGVNSDHTRWSLSQPAAISAIEEGTHEFVVIENEQSIKLVVMTRVGQKYLKLDRESHAPGAVLAPPPLPSRRGT